MTPHLLRRSSFSRASVKVDSGPSLQTNSNFYLLLEPTVDMEQLPSASELSHAFNLDGGHDSNFLLGDKGDGVQSQQNEKEETGFTGQLKSSSQIQPGSLTRGQNLRIPFVVKTWMLWQSPKRGVTKESGMRR